MMCTIVCKVALFFLIPLTITLCYRGMSEFRAGVYALPSHTYRVSLKNISCNFTGSYSFTNRTRALSSSLFNNSQNLFTFNLRCIQSKFYSS